jgi:hypothetical protein
MSNGKEPSADPLPAAGAGEIRMMTGRDRNETMAPAASCPLLALAHRRRPGRAGEPGCLLYSLLRSRKDTRDYIVHEQYADQTALDAQAMLARVQPFWWRWEQGRRF